MSLPYFFPIKTKFSYFLSVFFLLVSKFCHTVSLPVHAWRQTTTATATTTTTTTTATTTTATTTTNVLLLHNNYNERKENEGRGLRCRRVSSPRYFFFFFPFFLHLVLWAIALHGVYESSFIFLQNHTIHSLISKWLDIASQFKICARIKCYRCAEYGRNCRHINQPWQSMQTRHGR